MFLSRVEIVSFLAAASLMGASADSSSAFSYDPASDLGPANWGGLDIEGNVCDGSSNSPIAVETSGCTKFEDYVLKDGECTFKDIKFELTSTGVKGSYPDTCVRPKVEIPGIPGKYEAVQFHIHSSSEHTIDGNHFGAELHTVHAEVDGDRFAVVGMMIQQNGDEENKHFKELLTGWEALAKKSVAVCEATSTARAGAARALDEGRKLEGDTEHVVDTAALVSATVFSPYLLVPEGSAYYHYDGGLTTPPCSEVVWWNLADKPVALNTAQFHQLIDLIINYVSVDADCKAGTYAGPAGSTSRPPVALNGRTVDRICPVGFVEESDSAATFSLSTIVGAAFVGAAMLF